MAQGFYWREKAHHKDKELHISLWRDWLYLEQKIENLIPKNIIEKKKMEILRKNNQEAQSPNTSQMVENTEI